MTQPEMTETEPPIPDISASPAQAQLIKMRRARDRWWWWVAYGKPDCETLDEYVRAAIPDDVEKCGDFTCGTCSWYPDDLEERKRVVAQKRAEFRADRLKFHVTEFDGVRYEFYDWHQPTIDYFSRLISRGRKLCLKHPPAVQGANGSTTCFRLFIALVKGLDIDGSIAVELVWSHYNARCVDTHGAAKPWSWDELVHKANDAVASSIPVGFLLHDLGDRGRSNESTDDEAAAGGVDQKGVPEGVAHSSTKPVPRPTASGSSTTKPPINLTTVEVIGVNGLHTKDIKLDVDTIRLRIVDGPFEGQVRSLSLDWPPSPRSKQRWDYLARALGLNAFTDPRRELLRRRFGVEIEPDARCEFRIGNFHPL